MTRTAGASARRAAAAAWLALTAACGGDRPTGSSGGGPPPVPALRGADISALERIEQAGGAFKDSGRVGDAVTIMRAHGSNTFRLRLFVNPDYSEVQVNDLDYTARMAPRIKAAGATLLLDIHYSDTWADPAHQITPAAWATLALDSLEQQVERYTAGVMARLARAGALPDIVQVGNEVDAGMLWPLGELHYDSDSLPSWDRFTRLLKAAIRGVRDSLPPGAAVRVMVHYSQGANAGGTQWFFDHVNARGVDYDLIGLSYYPWWHGTLAEVAGNLQATAQRYGRDIMVVETAYPWRAGGWEGMVTNAGAMTWPATPQGQAQFLRSLATAVAVTPGGHGLGVLWWYPESIQVPGLFVWGGGSLAWFDDGGNVLEAASVFGSGSEVR